MAKCQNPFCPMCHPDAFDRLQMDRNTLNIIEHISDESERVKKNAEN